MYSSEDLQRFYFQYQTEALPVSARNLSNSELEFSIQCLFSANYIRKSY